MRDLIITQNITLDGVVSNDSSWFGPADQEGDMGDVNEALMAQAHASDAFLVGRTTFEEMRGYWPKQADDTTGVTEHLDRVAKYVVSTTLDDPGWAGTTILRGPLEDDVRALKEAEGSDIVVTGSVALCHALIDADLVDEYRCFVYPHVEGRGRRLFEGRTSVPPLRTVEARAFRSGIVLTRHRVVRP
ncbi:dihydrofolate reductase family protein [Patulibacter sp.]|uniref:dihydrofolate reductase family protein n=1 Tax=Patulibacter sp. TaxID=1912859 RepID=UPI00271F13B0|nr:dihydrofolate reductase family protein [Patulibacter sp.]MDO9407610.1 dihydrofolate reductase family protein [Patulibacter sp.]